MDKEHPLLKRVFVAIFVDPEVTWEGEHSSVNIPSACGLADLMKPRRHS